jgi:hypothetical protein
MIGFIKEVAVLLFKLENEIKKKTNEYKKKREERFRLFSDKLKDDESYK